MYKSESFGATFDMVFLADVTTQHALDSAEYKIEQLPRFNQNSSSWSSQNDKQKNIERVDQKSLTWNVGPFWDSQNTNYDYSEGEQASVVIYPDWLFPSPNNIYHIISYHIIYHIPYIIYHIIYHISYIIYHIISYHISYNIYHISYHISYHIISYHIISYIYIIYIDHLYIYIYHLFWPSISLDHGTEACWLDVFWRSGTLKGDGS